MATDLGNALRHLRRATQPAGADELADEELLACFVARRDEAAFEALVRRHGPMVLGVCRRLLRRSHDVEDAFQATFLVLVRKAGSIARPRLLGNWLYGVAYRTALRARVEAAHQQAHERQVSDMAAQQVPAAESDVQALLDHELNRLPQKYRVPIVLCDLEDVPRAEAARRLGCPAGTLSSRLARGREMLRQRLLRRGVTPSAAALAALLNESASASVPASLLASTVRAGLLYAAGAGAAAPVAALTEGVLKTMFLTRLKIATVLVLTLTAAAAGLYLHARPVAPPAAAAVTLNQEKPKPATDSVIDPGLLKSPDVQRELKLNQKQLDRLRAIRARVEKKYEAELNKAREDLKDDRRIPGYLFKRQRIERKIGSDEHEALREALPDLLKDDQLKRLREVSLQARGFRAFRHPQVVQALKLTDQQRKEIAVIEKDTLEKLNRPTGKGPGFSGYIRLDEKTVREREKLQAAALKKIVIDVLSEAQEKKWKAMVGKPFDLTWKPTKPASRRSEE
jgi:RNA polymerase sigma factor (sigma-70 family)